MMEIRNILSKKSAKLLVLLLINMLIVTVSAAMYYSLSMSSTIDVYAADVYFQAGTDNGTSGLVVTLGGQNTTAVITGIRAYPNASLTYTDPIRVRNNASAGTYAQLRLVPVTNPSGNADQFVYIKFLLNATTAEYKWLNYTSNGSTWTNPTGATSWTTTGIDGGEEWPIVIYTMANATATATSWVTIEITIDVD